MHVPESSSEAVLLSSWVSALPFASFEKDCLPVDDVFLSLLKLSRSLEKEDFIEDDEGKPFPCWEVPHSHWLPANHGETFRPFEQIDQ